MQACTPAAGVVSNLSLEGLENYAKMNGKITQSCILKRCFFCPQNIMVKTSDQSLPIVLNKISKPNIKIKTNILIKVQTELG